jgi:hypothetical protein
MQDFIHILGVSWTFVFVDSIKESRLLQEGIYSQL